MCSVPVTLRRLTSADVPLLCQLNAVFGDAFAEPETYAEAPPSNAYLENLLAKEHVVALVALAGEEVVGGLVAYELDKFEQARREVYIYDLGLCAEHRRQHRDGPDRTLGRDRRPARCLCDLRSGRLRRRSGHRALREARGTRGNAPFR